MGVTRQKRERGLHFPFNLIFLDGSKGPVTHLPILKFQQSVHSMGSLAESCNNESGPLELFKSARVLGKPWCLCNLGNLPTCGNS